MYNVNCTPQSRPMCLCGWTVFLCAHQLNLTSWFYSGLVPVPPPPPLCFSKYFLFVDFTWSRSVWFCRDLPVRATGPWLHHRGGYPCHRVPAQIHFWPQPSATQWTPFIDICKSEHSQSVYILHTSAFFFGTKNYS